MGIIAQTQFFDVFKQRSGQRQNLQSARLVGFQFDLLAAQGQVSAG